MTKKAQRGRAARRKGARGELEFFNLINDLIGLPLFFRNLAQTRGGGEDSDTSRDAEVPISIEVKRVESLSVGSWIRQADEQAARAGKQPVLAYRRNGEDWNIWVKMSPEEFANHAETAWREHNNFEVLPDA